MTSDKSIEKKLNNKDLRSIFWRSMTLEASWNYERQQNLGYSYAMNKILTKLYPNKEQRSLALKRHMAFFNCTSYLSTFIMGISASMEEKNAQSPEEFDSDSINNVKSALMGPLSGIGDSFFQGTLRVIATGIGTSLALHGNILGPILFLLIFNIPAQLVRWIGLKKGYDLGVTLLNDAESSGLMSKLTYGASILGLMVIGGMTGSMVIVKLGGYIGQGSDKQSLQAIVNSIMPNLLPLGCVMLIYWLLRKKVSTIVLLFGIFGVSILFAWLGILKA